MVQSIESKNSTNIISFLKRELTSFVYDVVELSAAQAVMDLLPGVHLYTAYSSE
jgi:hypothetical protein